MGRAGGVPESAKKRVLGKAGTVELNEQLQTIVRGRPSDKNLYLSANIPLPLLCPSQPHYGQRAPP